MKYIFVCLSDFSTKYPAWHFTRLIFQSLPLIMPLLFVISGCAMNSRWLVENKSNGDRMLDSCGEKMENLQQEACLSLLTESSHSSPSYRELKMDYLERMDQELAELMENSDTPADLISRKNKVLDRYNMPEVRDLIRNSLEKGAAAALAKFAENHKFCNPDLLKNMSGSEENEFSDICAKSLSRSVIKDLKSNDSSLFPSKKQVDLLSGFLPISQAKLLRTRYREAEPGFCSKLSADIKSSLSSLIRLPSSMEKMFKAPEICTSVYLNIANKGLKEVFRSELFSQLYDKPDYDLFWMLGIFKAYGVEFGPEHYLKLKKEMLRKGSEKQLGKDMDILLTGDEAHFETLKDTCTVLCSDSFGRRGENYSLDEGRSERLMKRCPKSFDQWHSMLIGKFIDNERYDKLNDFVQKPLGRPEHKTAWLKNTMCAISEDLSSSLEKMDRSVRLCEAGKTHACRKLVSIKDYGLLRDFKAELIRDSLAIRDKEAKDRIDEKLEHSCLKGKRILLDHIRRTRNQNNSGMMSRALAETAMNSEEFENRIGEQPSLYPTPELLQASVAVFNRCVADTEIREARRKLRRGESIEAYRKHHRADQHWSQGDSSIKTAILKGINTKLKSKAAAAGKRGYYGLAYLYNSMLLDLFRQDSANVIADYKQTEQMLTHAVQKQFTLDTDRLKLQGEYAESFDDKLIAGLDGMRTPQTENKVNDGLKLTLQPDMLDLRYSEKEKSFIRSHPYYIIIERTNPRHQKLVNRLLSARIRYNEVAAEDNEIDIPESTGRESKASKVISGVGAIFQLIGSIAKFATEVKMRKHIDDLETELAHTPETIMIRKQKIHQHMALNHYWSDSASITMNILDQEDKQLCLVQSKAAGSGHDSSYGGDAEYDLKENPFDAPNHEKELERLFEKSLSDLGSKTENCIEANISNLIATQMKKLPAGRMFSAQEKTLERKIRLLTFKISKAPQMDQLIRISGNLLPLDSLRKDIRLHYREVSPE